MALKRQFATDTDLETQGIVIDYGDVRVRIARAGGSNRRFTRVLDQKTRPLRRAIAAGSLDEERGRTILAQAYAEAVVLSWETRVDGEWRTGIDPADVGESGDELLPDTPENRQRVFEYLPDFFADLQQQAQSSALFRAEINEELAGN